MATWEFPNAIAWQVWIDALERGQNAERVVDGTPFDSWPEVAPVHVSEHCPRSPLGCHWNAGDQGYCRSCGALVYL